MAENIYKKIMEIRKEFTEQEIKKSGHNTFQHFRYLELYDFVPLATELCCKYGLYTHIDILSDHASMTVINTETPTEQVHYQLKIPELPVENSAGKTLQNTGSLETYVRRYLYMLFLDLAVPDTVDAGNNNINPNRKPTAKELQQRKQRKQASRQTPSEKPKKDYEEQVVENRHKPRNDANTDMQIKDPAPLKTLCNQCIQQLRREGKEVTKPNMRVKATIAKRDGRLDAETHSQLLKYIDEYCPEEEAK